MISGCVFNIPNCVTLLRICCAVPLSFGILTDAPYGYSLAVSALVLAGVSDWMDGVLARWLRQQTQFGAWLDPVADKILINTTFISLTVAGFIPWWVSLVVFLRDAVIVLGAAAYFTVHQQMRGSAHLLGKLSTALQFSVLAWCVLAPAYGPHLNIMLPMLCLTLLSGGLYVKTWSREIFKSSVETITSQIPPVQKKSSQREAVSCDS